MRPARGYQGSYLIGLIVIVMLMLRSALYYQSNLPVVILLLALYGLLYALEPWLASRLPWHRFAYFPVQTGLVVLLCSLQPFLDVQTILFLPLGIQAMRTFSWPAALAWIAAFVALISITLMFGLGWAEGLAFLLIYLAVGAFLLSYDSHYARTQADQAESQRLLADLQSAHQQLQGYASQTEELAAARERNRLARELHDSVSQTIFSIRLTAQAARILLEREPARVPEQVDRLQAMTTDALAQLRSLIAQLRPP